MCVKLGGWGGESLLGELPRSLVKFPSLPLTKPAVPVTPRIQPTPPEGSAGCIWTRQGPLAVAVGGALSKQAGAMLSAMPGEGVDTAGATFGLARKSSCRIVGLAAGRLDTALDLAVPKLGKSCVASGT